MGSPSDLYIPSAQPGDEAGVVYEFVFDRLHCDWDALVLAGYGNLEFPGNRSFAWCGRDLGLTPSNRKEDSQTLIRLPNDATRITLEGHAANQHYGFVGGGGLIQALDAKGRVEDEGVLTDWASRSTLILQGRAIRELLIPSSKPVYFIRRLIVQFVS